MDPNEKIQLDDITFDDVISGDGVDTVAAEEIAPLQEEEKVDALEDIGIEDEDDDEIEEEIKDREVEEEEEEEDEYEENEEDSDEEGSFTVVSEILDKLGYD